MKRFDFPLERVRSWRQTQVEIERVKLQKLNADRRRLELAREELSRQLREASLLLQGQGEAGGVMDVSRFAELDRFRLYVKSEQHRLHSQEARLHHYIDRQKQQLLKARRDFELLERLKERAMEVWQHEYDRETEATASELFLAKWSVDN